ncbi:hypothetical protein [Streptomyces sp. NPDC029554]|uniref:hypothetical protein n=1 Tax=Streptomyces sp. NPDC029554 TaxID=3155126 RepID=UPI0033F66436
MNTRRVNAAAGVIHGSQVKGKQTATGLAADLESACLLQDPEAAKELAEYRALELGDVDGRISASCGQVHHPTWLRAADDTRGCPWCEVDAAHEAAIGANLARHEEEQENARLRLALASAQRGRRDARGTARDAVRVAEESVAELKREHEANAELRKRVAELEAELSEAGSVSETLHQRLTDEKLAGSALYAALTMPTTPEQRQAALDRFLAVAQRTGQLHAPTEPDALTQTFAPVAALREDPHDSPLHHTYRLGRDLPQPGGAP